MMDSKVGDWMALSIDTLGSLKKQDWGVPNTTLLWGYTGTRNITFDCASSKNATYVSSHLQAISAKFLRASVILRAHALEPDHWSGTAPFRPCLLQTIYSTLDRAADMYTSCGAAAKLTDWAKAMAFFEEYVMADEGVHGGLGKQYGDEEVEKLVARWVAVRGYWPVVW
jgi:hypothetical protein